MLSSVQLLLWLCRPSKRRSHHRHRKTGQYDDEAGGDEDNTDDNTEDLTNVRNDNYDGNFDDNDDKKIYKY